MRNTRSNFTKTKLLPCLRRRYPAAQVDALKAASGKVANRIAIDDFSFSAPETLYKNGKTVFFFDDWQADIIARRVDELIRDAYAIRFPNRNEIIWQLAALLRQKTSYGVIRADVTGFFENISFEQVTEKLVRDRLTCPSTNALAKSLSKATRSTGGGLPRGLPLASTLSEVWMQGLDRKVRSLPGVYFYERFVDDFIILTFSDTRQVSSLLDQELVAIGLLKNPSKSDVIEEFSIHSKPFEYLGYAFKRRTNASGNGEDLETRMALSKKNKIKSRLVKSLLDFNSTQDFSLLEKRFRFLAEAYPIYNKGGKVGNLKGGLAFHYSQLSTDKDLQELDAFKARLLFSTKGSVSRRATGGLTLGQKKALAKISFRTGFHQVRYNKFSPIEVTRITRVFR